MWGCDAPLVMLGIDQHLHYNQALINVLWISLWYPAFFLGGYWECKPFFPKEKANTMAGKVTFVDLWR